MPDFTRRRRWEIELDGRSRVVDVEYAMLTGFMTILLDGSRLARGWREWQTVFGGAVVIGETRGHRIEARVTQVFGGQEYRFALTIDGHLQPGSDDQPTPGGVRRSTARQLLIHVAVIAAIGFAVGLVAALTRG